MCTCSQVDNLEIEECYYSTGIYTNYEYKTPVKPIIISTSYVYSTESLGSHILLTDNVTVLDTTAMLVTVLLVCLYSRHNKGLFLGRIWCIDVFMHSRS